MGGPFSLLCRYVGDLPASPGHSFIQEGMGMVGFEPMELNINFSFKFFGLIARVHSSRERSRRANVKERLHGALSIKIKLCIFNLHQLRITDHSHSHFHVSSLTWPPRTYLTVN